MRSKLLLWSMPARRLGFWIAVLGLSTLATTVPVRAQTVAAGYYHACAIATGGVAKCWGWNLLGTLGDGTTTDQPTPVSVLGLGSGVTSIATGDAFTCAVTAAGGVKCWGSNYYGQLGDGSKTDTITPVDVVGLSSGVTSVTAGGQHACALLSTGGVKCWGQNGYGQLGDGIGYEQLTPVDVVGLGSGVTAITSGSLHSCAIGAGGALKCWGDNSQGQIGNGGAAGGVYSPVSVAGLGSGVISVSGGDRHTCAVSSGGAAYCWGENSNQQLGDGSGISATTPVAVFGLGSGISAVGAGFFHSCALTVGGAVQCWGGGPYASDTPAPVPELTSGVTEITTGAQVSCARQGTAIYCWGADTYGGLGDGNISPYETTAVAVVGFGSALPSNQTITFGALAGKALGAAPFSVSATASSGLAVAFGSATPSVCTVGGSGGSTVTLVAAGTCTVVANQAGNSSYNAAPQVSQSFTVSNGAQTITFAALGAKNYGDAAFIVSATASSSLTVAFTSTTTAVCTVAGTTVTLVAAGTCTIAANQAGNANYAAAPQVTRSFTVSKGVQTITFGALTGRNVGDAAFAVSATASSSLAVTFTSTTTSICTVSGSNVTVIAVGTCTIAANQAGNANYNAATQVTQSFTVSAAKTAQTITFGALAGKAFGSGTFAVSATASSSLAVTFTSTTTSICTVSGSTVTLVAVGTCTIAANQAGNATYAVAPQVTQSFAVSKGAQTITFGAQSGRNVGDAPYTVSATASSALTVAFTSSTTSICTVSGTTVTIVAVGTCTLAANQGGDANYNAATQVTQSFAVAAAKTAQTITFAALGGKNFGDAAFAVSATASSALTVTFTSTTTAVCTVSGSTVTLIAAGTCTVAADQSGNATYAAAPQVARSFTVAKASQTITFGAQTGRNVGDAPYTVSASATSSLAVTFTSSTTSICTVSGTTVTIVAIGTCTLAANQAGNANYNAASQVTQSFAVAAAKTAQTITFAALAGRNVGDAAFAVTATATSGLATTFTSTTTPVCTVSGSNVTVIAVGTCTIAANQAGNATYAAAPQVTQSFAVAAAKTAQTITFAAPGAQTFGAAPFAISATASSGLVVAFTSTTAAVCTVSGTSVTIVAAGTCTIAADQAGNASYTAAPQVVRSFTVAKAAQTITFGALIGRNVGDAPFAVSATSSSALAVAFTSTTTGVCTVSGTSVTIVAVGTCTIAANQAGNANYNAATQVTQSFAVAAAKVSQTITFAALSAQALGTSPFAVGATASSGLAIVFTSTTPAVCTVTGANVTLVAVGTCTIAADQSGNSGYLAAPQVTQSFAVTKGAQTITFPPVSSKSFGVAPFAVAATSSSALPVAFTSATTAVCTVSGSTVTLITVGTCTIAANQAGSSNYNAATQVSQSIVIAKGSQTITGLVLASATVSQSQVVSIVGGGSGNPITVVATMEGSFGTACVAYAGSGQNNFIVRGDAPGTCTVTASQAASTNYAAAQPVSASALIVKANQTITFGALPSRVFGDAPFVPTGATSSAGLTINYSSTTPGVCTLPPSDGYTASYVSLIYTGTCTIAADQPGDTSYNAAARVTQSFSVTPGAVAPQAIAGFAPSSPVSAATGSTFTLSATGGGSGNAITYASATSEVCSVSGNTVTVLSAGTCTLTANEAGNSGYAPALQVAADVVINTPGSGAPTLLTPVLPHAVKGQAFNASISLGGAPSFSNADVAGLPAGITAVHNGSGTLTLSGQATTSGTFALSVSASNASGSSSLPSSLTVDNFARNVTALSAGDSHACAVLDGGVRCWGNNANGQLGNNSTVQSTTSVVAVSPGAGATAVSAGTTHTCAVVNGGVQCWGGNDSGQLGNNTTVSSLTPVVALPAGSGATGVSASGSTSCAVVNEGIRCWGYNTFGKLGNNSTTNSPVPVTTIAAGSGATSVSVGLGHVCAVVSGGVQCWGTNAIGELGNNSHTNSLVPVVALPAGSGATSVTSGGSQADFTCAVVATSAMCWGYNGSGQLGYNQPGTGPDTTLAPHLTLATGNVTGIGAGGAHACAVTSGGVQCWGLDDSGQLGDGSTSTSIYANVYQAIPASSGVTDVSVGGKFSCVVINGGVQCWGANGKGQLGDPLGSNALTPTAAMPTGYGVTTVSASNNHSCTSVNGGVQCWGANTGLGAQSQPWKPFAPFDLKTGATRAVTGMVSSCAVASGGLQCFGKNSSGVPVLTTLFAVGSKVSAASISSANGGHSCAVVDGGVQCWGPNYSGQLGNGSTTASATPVVAIAAGSGATSVAVGDAHTCAVVAGGVRCWGLNTSGQLGNNSTAQSSTPVSAISSGGGATAVANGPSHSCAVVNGGLQCWGYGSGAFGSVSLTSSIPLAVIASSSKVTAVATSQRHTCVVRDGGVQCLGDNTYGQLGNGTVVRSDVPVQAILAGSNVSSVAVAFQHSCAVAIGGTVCWGNNWEGGVGDPATFGLRKVFASLTPLSAPAAPAITGSTPGQGSITLAISPPSDNGGQAITGYTATCTAPGRATVTTSAGPSATSITLTGLIGGVSYSCSVTATNAVGVGSSSGTATATPSTFPGSVALNAPADYSAFQAPASIALTAGALPVTGATVTKVEFFQGVSLVGTVTASPFTYTWSNSVPGNYVVTAKMTDSLGGTATSAPIHLQVTMAGESITYLHNDLAGSPIAASDASGVVVWKESYRPYGSPIRNETASSGNRQFFTGKPYDTDSGLSYFGARYYDPVIGRFMGTDPAVVSEANYHSFNRYGYSNNNPYKYFDPSGRSPANVVDWAYFAHDVGGLLVNEIVFVAAKILNNEAVANLAIQSMVEGRDFALVSTLGLVSPVPGLRTYITYGIRNEKNEIIYVGRSSGIGTPESVLKKRESSHEHKGKGTFEIMDQQNSSSANRGAEDVIYNRERLNAESEGRKLLNKENPIGNRNRNGKRFVEDYVKDK